LDRALREESRKEKAEKRKQRKESRKEKSERRKQKREIRKEKSERRNQKELSSSFLTFISILSLNSPFLIFPQGSGKVSSSV
jgi:hypothetical protein